MILTHCPFSPTPKSADWNPKDKGSLDYKGKEKYFADMVAYMDQLVGKIVSKVDELGLSENTLILFTGDNSTDKPVVTNFRGIEYPGGKKKTTDNGTHVPLIARWKGTIKKNTECLELVDFSDFLPTICEAANINIPSEFPLDGQSFFHHLTGEQKEGRKWIYSWYSMTGKLREIARTTEYKLYKSGQFYNVKKDFFEKKPIEENNMTAKEKEIHAILKDVIDSYQNVPCEVTKRGK